MRSESVTSVDELFAGAVALAGDERSRYLDAGCGANTVLRGQVEELLRYHDEAGDFLEVPPITSVPSLAIERPSVAEALPERIGHFRIERVLGTGGMGRVYLAESEQPRRWVALKVVRSGLESESLRRRFEQEAQVVALLQHPGIAQLYEAGTASPGDGVQPYFAMEYVDGPTLKEYARGKDLSTRTRLELFCKVCDAVDHAHKRGVVHRDLKPGNILVDASGQPKILDFGVARLIDPETGAGTAATTLHTHAGQLIGTLSYMSPEQVAGNPRDVDARSDVYSLGVILFEMLAGRLPHDVSSSSIPEAIRAIREDAPTSLSSIDRALRGDIETIVGRALEKEASRRYQSAAELAGDIRRSLRDEPIVARPPSTWYQLGKFAKRNKVLVGGVAATIVALSAGLVAAVWQGRQAEAARRSEEKINHFLEEFFTSPDPDVKLGKDVKVMTFLDRSAKHLEEELADEPQVRAVLHRTIGSTYLNLTDFAKAESHLVKAYEIDHDLYGDMHPETLSSLTSLVILRSEQGRSREALELGKRAWEVAQAIEGKDDPDRLSIAGNLADIMDDLGDWKGAEALERYVLKERERLLPHDSPSVWLAKSSLGRTLSKSGRVQEALQIQREAVDAYRKSGRPMDTKAYTVILGLANTLLDARQEEEAGALADELLANGLEMYGPDHNAILSAKNIKAYLLLKEDRYPEAEAAYRELVAAHERNQIPAIDGLARVKNNLGEALRAQNEFAEAEAEYRGALHLLDDHGSAPDRLRIGILNNLATSMRLRRDFQGALPIYKELVEDSEKVLAPDDVTVAISKYGYGVVLMALRKPEESEAQLQGAYDITRKNFTDAEEPVITVMRSLLNLYTLWGKPEKAEYWRQKLPEKYRND